jgi:hypothetical protein
MTTTTRRTLVLGAAIATIPVAPSILAVAGADDPVLAGQQGEDDPELLALGVELEELIVIWHRQCAIDQKELDDFKAAAAAAGCPHKEHDEFMEMDDADRKAYMAAHVALSNARHSDDDPEYNEAGESIIWNEIHDRLYPLCDRILSFRPRTVAGVAIQARAISLSADTLWDEQQCERDQNLLSFIEAMCLFAGVRPVKQDDVITSPKPADPVFAAIEAHKGAIHAVEDIFDKYRNPPEAELDRLASEEREAGRVLASVVPQTIMGVNALREYTLWLAGEGHDYVFPAEGESFDKPLAYFVQRNSIAALKTLRA